LDVEHMTDTDTAGASAPTDQADVGAAEEDRLAVEIGFYGAIEMDPCLLWNDPDDARNDDAAELMELLARRRREREPAIPGVAR
jgi:hypothetical protein